MMPRRRTPRLRMSRLIRNKIRLPVMARHYLSRFLLSSALLSTLVSCASADQAETPRPVTQPVTVPAPVVAPAAPPPAPVRAAPTRPEGPKLWPTTSLRGAEYIDVREIAQRFGLKANWVKSEPVMTLSDKKSVRFTFEEKQRDFHFDGLRIFLGKNVIREKDSLWLSKLDVIKIVAPLFRPSDHVAMLPATSPRLIVIDPGHGGRDPGKENLALKVNEKTYTLDVSLRLKKILEAQGWKVILTRNDDRELSPSKKSDLQMRNDVANRNKADVFLSIHFNSVERNPERVTGVETYVMTPQFMFSAGEEVAGDMTKIAYPGNRLDYGNLLLGEELHRAMITTLKTPDRGFKRARLAVLRMLDCPGVLVECAYLSNNTEARRVGTVEFRQKIAEALAVGLQNYSNTLETLRPKPAPPSVPVAPASAPGAPAKARN